MKPVAAGSRPRILAGGPAQIIVCDDSAIVRAALLRILASSPDIEVVARVPNGQAAIDAVRQRLDTARPVEVLVLDLEMPVMDGLTALPLLLQADPGLRVLISSTSTTPGARAAMRALDLGAADYMTKPRAESLAHEMPFDQEMIGKIVGLARIRRVTPPRRWKAAGATVRPPGRRITPALLAIGSSTGGPQALFTLIAGLRTIAVPVVVAQHMPPLFTPILAEHITRLGSMPCAEAVHGETLRAGHVYIAPGGRHLLVRSAGAELQAILSDDPSDHHCRPSVDLLLQSAAAARPAQTIVVMLTGMGRDGLAGTRTVVEGGGVAIAQDEATSVIWGMPGAIAKAGLCTAVLPISDIAAALRRMLGA